MNRKSSGAVDPSLQDLVPDYVAKRAAELKGVEDLVKRGDFESVEHIGHRLSGNAELFGFDLLAAQGRLLESAAQSSDGARVLELAREMEASLR